ncbi:hypothetical protein AAG906_027406 [Vitis piasezkii]
MALHSFAVVVVVVALVSCLLAPPAVEASSVNISTYWGTDPREGGVKDGCNASLYSIFNIGFVDRLGYDWPPRLNIHHYCDVSLKGCKYLGAEIEECQKRGVKVLISIGGPGGDYNLASPDDATRLANYLWNAYLGGNQSSVDRPFDTAILDGVDFFIQAGNTLYWDVLAEALRNLSNNGTQMELSASPKCKYPDKYLGAAIQTGLFDYAQVRFYDDDSCQYNGSFEGMKSAWNEWTAEAKVDKIFAGVTACKCDQGYVDVGDLVSGFLPYAEKSPKFGGLMVWYIYTDHQSGYSAKIKDVNSAIQTAPSGVEVE